MRFFFIVIVGLLVSTTHVTAQIDSESFVISVFPDADIVAPTIPTLLSVEPVTSSQINVAWAASTDNYAVGGYVVWRDGAPIATSTQLSYVDSGLTASTTYSYAIQAFDTAFNYSATSSSIATTTPALVVPPVVIEEDPVDTAVTEQGSIARAVARSIVIDTSINGAAFSIETARPTSLQLRWGRTASYELGYVVSDVFVRSHLIPLTDLPPRTTYEYELVGFTPYGNATVLRQGSFTTDGELRTFLPPNVKRFSAEQRQQDVWLSWEVPAPSDEVAYVRIVRSHLGFPLHPQDGAIVYQGLNTSALDRGILLQHPKVYYTAFLYDKSGQVSSGAVTFLIARGTASGSSTDQSSGGGSRSPADTRLEEPIQQATSTIATERITPYTRLPKLSDIILEQGVQVNDTVYTMNELDIGLAANMSFVVSLPVAMVSNTLKTIVVSVTDPTNNKKRYTYLLRINQDRTRYEATIPALDVVGRSEVAVDIYDYEAFVMANYRTPVYFTLPEPTPELVVFPDMLFKNGGYVAIASLVLLLLVSLWFLLRRRRTEDNTAV